MARPTSQDSKAMNWRKALTWLAIFIMISDTVFAGHFLARLRCRRPVRNVVSKIRCRGGLMSRLHSRVLAGASCGSSSVASGSCSSGEVISSGGGTVVSSGEIISGGVVISEGEVVSEGYYSGEVISDGYVDEGYISGEVISEGYVDEGYYSGEVISEGYVDEGYISSGEVISEGYVDEGYYSGEVISDGYVDEGYSMGEVISDGYVDEGYPVMSGGEVISDGCSSCNSGIVSEGIVTEGVGYTTGEVISDGYTSGGIGPQPLGPTDLIIEEGTVISVSEGEPASDTSASDTSATDTTEPTPAAPPAEDDSDLFSTPADPPTTPDPVEPAAPSSPEPNSGADDLFGPATGDAPPSEPAPSEPAGGADDLFGPEPSTPDEPADEGGGGLDDLFGSVPPAPDFVNDAVKETSIDLDASVSEVEETLLIFRKWTDDTDTYSTKGKLQDITNNSVRLLKENGKTCTVPFSRLSQVDLNYVQQQAARFGVAPLNLVAVAE